MSKFPAVFLDRDGVLNKNVFYPDAGEWESPRTKADLELCVGVGKALERLIQAGFKLFIVSNQPSFAKNKTSLDDLKEVAVQLESSFAAQGVTFCEAFYCYHHPQGVQPGYSGSCNCRKPAPYFLIQAAGKYDLDLSRSWMVGDRDSDIECGLAAGVTTIQVMSDHPTEKAGKSIPHFYATDLPGAVGIINAEISGLSSRKPGNPGVRLKFFSCS